MPELTPAEHAVAQAMYDIKPSMTGSMKLAKAISALVEEKLAEAEEAQRRKGGRPRKEAA